MKNPSDQKRRLLFDSYLLKVTITRLCYQLMEHIEDFSNVCIIGLQPRGGVLAERVKKLLEKETKTKIKIGYLDVSFYRDDFRRRETPIMPDFTRIPFSVEDKKIVLVDDVLFTGRTIRSALEALNAFGRPASVALLVLIDRLCSREIPIKANYIGHKVTTIQTQKVLVQLCKEEKNDNIWLIH